MDPHDPYETYGKPARSKFEAYLMEVAVADENLGRIRKAIDQLGLKRRTALIIGSDHGEAFGEHRLYTHGKAFYDVMVHVPMMIELPNAEPRTVKDFVSLMDLAPTVLDLFGIPTPGSWMAESLTPFLTGGRGDPNRLILMEEFSQSAMLFPDGLKVMKRRGALELYDVLRDPKEDHNLWDERGDEGPKRLELLEAYVRTHARKRAGREASHEG
jgi:arylsulfatase A-like enzyme